MYWADPAPWQEDPPELRQAARDQGLAWGLLAGAIGILVAPKDPHLYFRAIDLIPTAVVLMLAAPLAMQAGPLALGRWLLAERLAKTHGGVAARLEVRGAVVAADYGALWLDGSLLRFRGIRTELAIPASLASWFRREGDALRVKVDGQSVAFHLASRKGTRVQEILEAWPRSVGSEAGALTPDLAAIPVPDRYVSQYVVPILLGLGTGIAFSKYAFHLPPTTQSPALLTATLIYLASYALGFVQVCNRWRRTRTVLQSIPLPLPTPIGAAQAANETPIRLGAQDPA